MSTKPGVGVGIIIPDKEGRVLFGKRAGSHAPKYSIPGGGVELGETFEEAAIREAEEELGIRLLSPEVIAVTNNLETFRLEGVHYISVILVARSFEGKPRIMEPDKCSELIWSDPYDLPEPHFDASRLGIACYLGRVFYKGL